MVEKTVEVPSSWALATRPEESAAAAVKTEAVENFIVVVVVAVVVERSVIPVGI